MGVSYSAGVFFGAVVSRRSPLGDTLDECIDKHGGTPAPSGVRGVEIVTAGSEADEWIVIRATGSARSFGRNEGDCPPPLLLVEYPTWRAAIASFLNRVGAPAGTPIGWHFQGSVS